MILVIQLLDMGKGGTAGAAPCGPEIYEYNFAFEVAEFYLLTVGIDADEVRGRAAGLYRFECRKFIAYFLGMGSRAS